MELQSGCVGNEGREVKRRDEAGCQQVFGLDFGLMDLGGVRLFGGISQRLAADGETAFVGCVDMTMGLVVSCVAGLYKGQALGVVEGC